MVVHVGLAAKVGVDHLSDGRRPVCTPGMLSAHAVLTRHAACLLVHHTGLGMPKSSTHICHP